MEIQNLQEAIEHRWSTGQPHCEFSNKLKRFIQAYDEAGDWKFGGDGDNGEELLLLLDVFSDCGGVK